MSFLKSLIKSKSSLNEAAKKFDGLVKIDDVLRKQIQDTLLEMYDDIVFVCNKYNLSTYLLGGTLLGAVRHKGFIPWDDDLDIGMKREDYNKLVEIFDLELSKKYILCAPNYSKNPQSRFPKIIKKNTVFRGIGEDPNSLNGIFIDIFVIDNIPENKVLRNIKGFYCNFLEFVAGQVQLYENKSTTSKRFNQLAGKNVYRVKRFIGFIFSYHSSSVWLNRIDKSVQYNKPSQLCGLPTGRKHYFGEVFPQSVFHTTVKLPFCGRLADAPVEYHTYLENLHGNYMQIPPPEKREVHFIESIKL